MKTIPVKTKNGTIEATVDDSDYEHCMKHNWYLDSRTGYPKARVGKYGTLSLHRFIKGLYYHETEEVVDHINGNKLDNTQANLRWCSKAENCWNSRHKGRHGLKGIYWDTSNQRWRVRAQKHGKRYLIGLFKEEDLKEAVLAYNAWVKEHYGPFAFLNPLPGAV